MATLTEFFQDRQSVRYIFTGGKGGVGKTVFAAALALHFAREGKKTLLASLNPVHSLASVFNQPGLKGGTIKPVDGTPDLFGVEVEASEIIERYRENIGRRVRDFLKWADIPVEAKPFVDIAVTNPAFEESAMFDRMIEIMLKEGENYDRIVFDTAAVANAVRLIGLSKIYGLWLNRMIESRKEALSMRVQLSFRKEKIMEEVQKDPLMADLLSMNARFLQAKDILTDPDRTAFFFVTLPLALPISVVKRFIRMVTSYDIPVGGVLVNQVLDWQTIGGGAKQEEYLQNKYEEQLGYMTTIKKDLGDVVRGFCPLYRDEVVGLTAVERVAEDLFGFSPEYWLSL